MESLISLQPCLHSRVFMGRIVVSNDMYLLLRRYITLYQIEKTYPFLMTVFFHKRTDHTAIKYI